MVAEGESHDVWHHGNTLYERCSDLEKIKPVRRGDPNGRGPAWSAVSDATQDQLKTPAGRRRERDVRGAIDGCSAK